MEKLGGGSAESFLGRRGSSVRLMLLGFALFCQDRPSMTGLFAFSVTSISILFLIVDHGKAVSAEGTGGCCGAIAPEAGNAALTGKKGA